MLQLRVYKKASLNQALRESEVMTAQEQILNRRGPAGFMYHTACLQDWFGQCFPLSMLFSYHIYAVYKRKE